MRSVTRIMFIAALLGATALAVAAEDLGSANKLFGGGSRSTASGTKKATGKKKTSATHTVAKKKPAAKNTQARRIRTKNSTTAKADQNKAHTLTTPTGTKITKPAGAGTQAKADDRYTRFKVDEMASKPVETKLSPADEARFEDLIKQGNAARDDREYARAESAYKNARTIKPRDARAICGLGKIYSDQQRWDESENAYRAAMQLEPSNAMTQVGLSYVLTQPLAVADLSDRFAEAEKLARRATELSPRSALAFDQLGVAMEMRGQIGPETESEYRKAVQLDATFAPGYAHLGRLLRRCGQVDQSKQAYAQAVERSRDVGTMVLVAEVMQSEQRYADSVPLLKQALETDPRNPSALIMLGHALTVTGQYKDAESAFQRALTVNSNGYQANCLLASLYTRQGAYELAENALLQALRWAPAYENRQLAQQFVAVAHGYSIVGKTQQAQRAYAEASKLDPDSGLLSGRFRQ